MSKKPLKSQARNIVFNVFQTITEEGGASMTKTDVIRCVSKLTNVSEATIRRIVVEGSNNRGVFTTPGKNRKGGKKKIDLDDFDLEAIRNKVKEFYVGRKEVPTLKKLLSTLHDDIGFSGGKESLRLILKNIGFVYVKCQSQRKLLMERHDIVLHRCKYLERMKLNEEAGENKMYVVYLDETYIHSSCGTNKCWQSKDVPGTSKSVSPGARWIIVHAGGEWGFVPNCCLIYRSKSMSADYHHDMNSRNFKKWVTEKLIPNLDEPTIIVMDNARYHSVQMNKPPTNANCIADMKTWLTNNNIHYEDNWRKCKLLEVINQNKTSPTYEIDELLKSQGHEAVRLPPYHCQLNPIEMIWGIMKQKVAEVNVNRPASDIKHLTEEAFNQIGADVWKRCCDHVHKIEKEYYEQDKVVELMQDRFIINTASSSNSSDSDKQNEQDLSQLESLEASADSSATDRQIEQDQSQLESLEVDWLGSLSEESVNTQQGSQYLEVESSDE